MKKFYFLTLLTFVTAFAAMAQPAAPAATPPARNASDVVSIYGSAYTNVDSTDFYPNWGQTTLIEEFYVATDTMIKYSNFNYQGLQFKNNIDVSNMTKLHLDLWTANATAFDVFLINTSVSPAVEQPITLTPTLAGWNSFDIDLSSYNTIALHTVGQIKLVTTPFGGAPGPTVYLDNIYFYKTGTTPTITAFSIPVKAVGSPAFTITAPTSNSSGAFTYTSSNLAVATVSGSTITVVGVGSTTIKATQAAAGGFVVGTKSTTFNVVSGLPSMPTVAAPTPTKAQANVISLFSNAYQNRTVDTWSASWDAADVSDLQIAGNDTKKYTNLVYSGIEFTTSTINVTNADFYHVDIWTPNATSFKIKLVDFGPNGTYAGGDDTEFEYTCNPPAFSTWVSYDIPMSAFTGLTTKAHLAQMLFVSNASTVYFDNVYFWANTAVLPASLKSFTAIKKENNVALNWSSSNETNLAGYTIEKSTNGITFESLQFVKANQSSTYNVIDAKPINGINYYRLKMIDNNGKFAYSNIISVKTTATVGMEIYPNPAKSVIGVLVDKPIVNGQIVMTDLLGKTVKAITVNNQQPNTTISLNVSTLNKGIYLVTLKNGEKVSTSRVVVE